MLLGANDSCHTCNDGIKSYADFIDETSECNWLGHGNNDEIFKMENLKGVNDYNYNASRSSCVIMIPVCYTNQNYGGENGTLMNFPYIDCQDPSNCGQGFIFTAYHLGAIQDIVRADSVIKSGGHNNDLVANTELLDKVLIRFNWQHQYGTPWNLEDVDCSANQTNFELWRSSIDFSEVIDYCGVRVFAYQKVPFDLAILKMVQKPFYKEHHLGWTAQGNFDVDDDNKAFQPSDFKILGRRAKKPTSIFENYNTYFDNYMVNYNTYFQNIKFHVSDSSYFSSFSGYSGSQLTIRDFTKSNQIMGLGIALTGDNGKNIEGYSYHALLYKLNSDYIFTDECYSSPTKKKMSTYYLVDSIDNLINKSSYQHRYGNDTLTSTRDWMPSLDNKQKCPSPYFVEQPCNFNLIDYITWNDTTKCLTVSPIPGNLFPGGELPKGYRIYYNDGEQKTLDFDPYFDYEPIELNFSHCYDNCELLDLYMQGKEELIISIDFYDGEGRILNNPGCEFNEFRVRISFDLCGMFEITSNKTPTGPGCCINTVSIKVIDTCARNKPILHKIANRIKLVSDTNAEDVLLSSVPNLNYDYEDYILSFSRELCEQDSSEIIYFSYIDGDILCDSPEISLEACSCDCPEPEIAKDWIEVITTPGGLGESCPEGMCEVTVNIDIPPFYNCYRFFNIDGITRGLMEEGKTTYSFCIPAGTLKTFEILIKKKFVDTVPCVVLKNAYCPVQTEPIFCKTGCDSVEWKLDSLTFALTGCPDCFVKGKYVSRRNTCEFPVLQELQVTEIEVYNSLGDTLACGPCMGSMADLHKKIILQAIFENNMGFKPILSPVNPDSLCDDTWRVSISSCWTHISNDRRIISGDFQPSTDKYIPCDTACCTVGLRVCRYYGEPPYITIDTLQGLSNPDLCIVDSLSVPTLSPPGGGGGGGPTGGVLPGDYAVGNRKVPCINRCNILSILESDPFYGLGKRALPSAPNNQISISNECQLLTYLNSESLHCIFDSDVNSSNFNISIYSITGQLLLKDNRNVLKGNNEFTIPLNNLNTGIYIIQAELNGICSKTDKLIIVR